MQKTHIIIGAYNHLPDGAEENSFEDTYQVSWRPFLSVLYRFPDIPACLHYSGTVLRWLEARHPEFLMLLEEMVVRKQVELLGGGFFSPLLPLIPGPDRLGQIELLTTFIRKAFGKKPRGCWLTEYAWEPGMAATLQTCGFDFCFLPERQFRAAGFSDSGLGEPAITEDQGKSLVVFPVFDASESFSSPRPPLESVNDLRARLGDLPLYTIFYSGETAHALWKASKLESPDVFFERSFAALQKEGLSIEPTTPSRYMKTLRRFEKAYFPTGASARLLKKSGQPRKDGRGLRRGDGDEIPAYSTPDLLWGSARSVLLRHEESHAIYAKMHYVRILVGQLRGDKSRKKSAQEELWRGQCGDAYWPGSTGGILDLPVRASAYSALIEAERTTRIRGSFSSGIIRADIDFDGESEILYQGSDLNAYVQGRGACLAELDSFKTRTNYVNVMAGPDEPRRRLCFRDGFCERGRFGEDSGTTADACFAVADSDRPASRVVFHREGTFGSGRDRRAVDLRKAYAFRKGGLTLDYEVENRDRHPASFRFFTELNLAAGFDPSLVGLFVLRGHEELAMDASAPCEADGVSGFRITNLRHEEHIEARSDRPFSVSHSPCFAVVENGFGTLGTRRYQGCRFLLGWDLEIPVETSKRFSVTLELRS